jgi:hypothetical protein
MQRAFEFIAELNSGRKIRMMYTGKTARHSKVAKKIKEDLKRMYSIDEESIKEIYLRPII